MNSIGRLTKKVPGHGDEMLLQDPALHTRIMLPMKKCIGESMQPSYPLKTFWHPVRRISWSGMIKSASQPALPKASWKAFYQEEDGGADKRWEDNTKDWTGLSFSRSLKAAMNWVTWWEIVTSSVVPQQLMSQGTDKMRHENEINKC